MGSAATSVSLLVLLAASLAVSLGRPNVGDSVDDRTQTHRLITQTHVSQSFMWPNVQVIVMLADDFGYGTIMPKITGYSTATLVNLSNSTD